MSDEFGGQNDPKVNFCVGALLIILCLCLMFYGSGNSFQRLRYAWPWQMTLKYKVTWFCTWPYLFQLSHMLELDKVEPVNCMNIDQAHYQKTTVESRNCEQKASYEKRQIFHKMFWSDSHLQTLHYRSLTTWYKSYNDGPYLRRVISQAAASSLHLHQLHLFLWRETRHLCHSKGERVSEKFIVT